MVQYRDIVQQALWALGDNKMRTLLSILGIFIGIIAVMAVGTVTRTLHHYVFSELSSYGLQTVWIYRDYQSNDPFANRRSGSGIDNTDLKLMRAGCCPAVVRVAPDVFYDDWSQLFRNGSRYDNAILKGVDQVYFEISRDTVGIGRSFRQEDINSRRSVAVIGPKVREHLFGPHQNPVGKAIRMGEHRFTVIGVLREKNRDFLASIGAAENYDVNNMVYIPYTVHQQLIGNRNIHNLVLEAASLERTQEAVDQALAHLRRHYGDRYSYKVDTMQYWVDTANAYLDKFSLFGLFAASISLLVGGVGIMNIMTTSVVERTREIGIRKALGASRIDIQRQFVLEAMVISVIGGGIGLICGYVIAIVAQTWLQIPLLPPWAVIFVALGVAIVTGLASGYYPARRAASLRPVEALRYD